ncbi:MAG: PhzF family phenazine biosynthesis protein [Thermoanaerobaculia bacterium]
MRVSFVTCDVFTEHAFAGNPLLVVPDARGLSDRQMQSIAREINYSESTFVLPADDPSHAYRQRTFVPVREIPFAGHPTIGTAVMMAALGRVSAVAGAEMNTFTIEVGFGPLKLELIRKNGRVSRVRMEQGKPVWDAPLAGKELLGKIASGLDIPYEALLGPLPPRVVSTGNRFLMLPVSGEAPLAGAAADPRILSLVESELDVLGIYCFVVNESGRVKARAFCPGSGVPEDPATGSAAGPLGVYLALQEALPGGAPSFTIDQGVEMGRPSQLEVEVLLDGNVPTGVRVSGAAVKMMEGSLELDG